MNIRHLTLGSRGKKRLNGIFTPFISIFFNSETTSFHYFSPRIPNLQKYSTSNFGKWGQKDVKTVPQKWSHKHTDRQTDKCMDKSTYRKHRPGGPMLWKLFRNKMSGPYGDKEWGVDKGFEMSHICWVSMGGWVTMGLPHYFQWKLLWLHCESKWIHSCKQRFHFLNS